MIMSLPSAFFTLVQLELIMETIRSERTQNGMQHLREDSMVNIKDTSGWNREGYRDAIKSDKTTACDTPAA